MNEPRQSAAATGTEGASLPTAQARTIWPGIGRVSAHEDLPKHLFTVAAMHARRALAAAAAIPPYTSSPIGVGSGAATGGLPSTTCTSSGPDRASRVALRSMDQWLPRVLICISGRRLAVPAPPTLTQPAGTGGHNQRNRSPPRSAGERGAAYFRFASIRGMQLTGVDLSP